MHAVAFWITSNIEIYSRIMDHLGLSGSSIVHVLQAIGGGVVHHSMSVSTPHGGGIPMELMGVPPWPAWFLIIRGAWQVWCSPPTHYVFPAEFDFDCKYLFLFLTRAGGGRFHLRSGFCSAISCAPEVRERNFREKPLGRCRYHHQWGSLALALDGPPFPRGCWHGCWPLTVARYEECSMNVYVFVNECSRVIWKLLACRTLAVGNETKFFVVGDGNNCFYSTFMVFNFVFPEEFT